MKRWTQPEIDYLEENWSVRPVPEIAKKLKRTEDEVLGKAYRLGLGSAYTTGEFLSANQVSKLLSVEVSTITDYWIAKRRLKAKKVAMIKRQEWRIALADLTKWLEANQGKWNSKRLELYGLGTEPKWLKAKRKADLASTMKTNQKWTPEADSILISLHRHGLTREEIGNRLGRSEKSVQRRLSRLKERGLLSKDKIMCKWSEREEALFRELEEQGLSDMEIAFALGRERHHIVDHRRALRVKGLYEGRKMVMSG